MNLAIAFCILGSALFTLVGTVFDWFDGKWSPLDVLFITTGSAVSIVFILSTLFGLK